ncbi:uncharacterized protein TEOVI_000759200 [Trypanosoma equiperdum]|uniref:Fe2OG dioxygenase domain-containing protein n=4 Tax=Trypanozoon TaxID=39700 RepID=Q582I2_TRYB2|nr:hypothetical protein, conserved [Trypanosoma brucei gambiense DAL972]XP_846190.1 hypothetical protein, conserved [Trypanosoma brucei brucei TREU927]AAX78849.1 hypothetical protein, conserved [Trypanosoma brucei]RHW71716.1 hypothetical protein DPX39_070067600 [Trypanosoma brucei equiperdum]SCU65653.1 hypothetical protein, conserved [Trypanosoma equiperdum]AAZ12631.1 hypothetical protein, conserved [Trypanosoma brucei brucei TREU927]CBH12766.1 hypothetical protein, conserved [Trypanosoma bru|eukprot:XP_011775046.1 hypothetical protein, conserved [Trypanosoma brucei gambiense DAL972]
MATNVASVSDKQQLWHSTLLLERLSTRRVFQNEGLQCAASVMRSEAARADGRLCDDFEAVLRGNALYIRRFACDEDDMALYNRLKGELIAATGAEMSKDGGLIEWSRHQIFENPTDISETFNAVVEMLAEYFDVDVYATRLNYYRDGQQWKPQHHDSHAYGTVKTSNNGEEPQREDFTVGITLGATRSLLFVHEASGYQFEFPQRNGDCFAFTSEVNNTFTHGVPRVNTPIGDRFSIIAWGRRRSLNERNGGSVVGGAKLQGKEPQTVEEAIEMAHQLVSRGPAPTQTTEKRTEKAATKNKKKNRLQ